MFLVVQVYGYEFLCLDYCRGLVCLESRVYEQTPWLMMAAEMLMKTWHLPMLLLECLRRGRSISLITGAVMPIIAFVDDGCSIAYEKRSIC